MGGSATAAAARTHGSRANASRFDALSAIAAAIVAGGVYVRTLAPGLVADLDTPMFQFIGRVLGVAHNPGYPLFVFLTFPFSYLPVGNLAYRINLFSALFASLTVCFTFLSARRLGCRTLVAAGMALGLAFGKVFWSQAVIAEVYTLNAAIVSGLLLALLEWRRTGQSGWFWCAVSLFSAGLGNHITILGFAPAAAAFVLLTDVGFLRQPRTVLISGALVAVGLLQYAFILIRSKDAAAYVESRATTLWALFDVVRARQFSDNLFAFDLHTVLFERVPLLVGSVFRPELGATGLLFALIGTAWLLLRRDAAGWFLLIGFAAIFVFTLNYEVVDSPVFLIPAILMSWLAAAVWAELIIDRLDARSRIMGAALAAATLALPAAGLRANFAANDMSRTTGADVHFERLFEKLPAKAALVREDFVVDRMLMYHLVGVGSARGRQIELVPADGSELKRRLDEGFGVFGFEKGIRRLRTEGLSFSDRPERLISGPLGDFLANLPIGSLVAIAVPRRHRAALDRSGASVAAIGGHDGQSVLDDGHRIVIGVAGAQGAIERRSDDDLSVSLGAGERIGTTEGTAPAAIEVETRGERAAIRLLSRDIVATREGAAVAVWDPAGRLSRTLVLAPTNRFHVPVATSQLSAYRLRGHWAKQNVTGDAWADLAGIAGTGQMMAHIPRGAELLLYLQDDQPLAPRTSEWSSNALKVDFTSFDGITDDAIRVLLADHGDPAGFVPSTRLHRIRMIAPSDGPDRIAVELALGGVPTRAIGRLSGDSLRPAAVFRVDTSDLLRVIDAQTDALLMGRDLQQQLIGYGWAPVEVDAAGPYRWMTATSARVLLPTDRNGDAGLQLQALREDSGPTSLAITLNGVTLPSQTLRQGWAWYEWMPPAGTLRPGTNELTITVDRLSPPRRDLEPRGLAVADLRVTFGRRSE